MSEFDPNQIRRLDGGLLLVFRELLRTRRASTVAQRLGLSPSAISHALNRLRDLFEDPLFIRRPHGFEPTQRALELGPKIESLIEMTGEALSRDAGFDPARSERMFMFAAPEFVTALTGGELINRLKAVAPKVSFGVSFSGEEDAFRALRRGEIDFALGRFGAARPGFTTEVLFEDCYCVAARKAHPRISGPLDWASWRDIGHVFAWSPSETASDSAEAGAGEVVARVAAVPQWLTALVLASSTDGLVTCPRRLAERHAERLGLQVLDPPFEPDVITVSVVRRAGVADTGADWFLQLVREAVGV
ncbi:LysR family transcriptional regulator [Phenylobacterium sp.]|jgi:DNA-binding transcriptional LysR family regulator|uniref:LysR family transcriptional regulator n=1 Tax=Phenylobacterium sp. TaxID=1871053 RepID=UPI002E335F71|nr:LysR family transcriptional regulator [Phenylobacterium sp.]HEX4711257.1 LysR family transcriptional regulator [Phenylobacterium sp.]